LKALAEWPEAPISATEWEERAEAITDKVAKGVTGTSKSYISDEKLFASALPSEPEEGNNSPPASAADPRRSSPGVGAEGKMGKPERERRSFQDLAKMAQTPPPPASIRPSQPPGPPSGVVRAAEAKTSDSGVVDLKAAALSDPMASSRASQTPLATAGLFDEDEGHPPVSARAASPVSQPIPSAPFSSPLSAPVSAVTSKKPKKSRAGLFTGVGLVTLAAMAAGAFFVVRYQMHKASVAMTTPAAEPAPPPAQPEPAAPAATAAPAPTDDLTVTQADDTNDKKVGGGAKVAQAPKRAAVQASPRPDKPSSPAPDPKLVAKDLPPPPAQNGALLDSIKSSVTANADPQPPPQQQAQPVPATGPDPGSVPQKPSQGAVTGAIGAALPGARACLKADDPVSKATITFGASGAVQSVTVTGAAAGKPAEACIKAALGRAKVPAFAQPTYTASVTVRPNS
jgi:hypothetical protein